MPADGPTERLKVIRRTKPLAACASCFQHSRYTGFREWFFFSNGESLSENFRLRAFSVQSSRTMCGKRSYV